MAAPTKAQLIEALRISYGEAEFHRAEREYCPAFEDLEDLTEWQDQGRYKSFAMYFNSPKNFTAAAQSTQTGTTGIRNQQNATDATVEVLGWILISQMIMSVGKDAKSTTLGRAELKQQMKDVLKDVNQIQGRWFASGHATGAIGKVLDAVVASTTINLAAPYFARAIMKGDRLDAWTADSSGTQQITAATVTNVNNTTRALTVASAVSCDAGSYLYITGTYGLNFNGYQGMIDNGVFQASLHGLSRTTYPDMNAQVVDITSGGAPQSLAENDIIRLLQLQWDQGGMPTKCVAGPGFAQAYLGITNPDRRYNTPQGKTNKYALGYKASDLLIMTQNGEIPYEPDPNVDPRTAYFYAPENFRLMRGLRMGWLGGDDMLKPLPTTTGYSTDQIAMMAGHINALCLEPWRTGALRGFKDAFGAGDTL